MSAYGAQLRRGPTPIAFSRQLLTGGRLRPSNRFEATGINTAIGLDETGINDGRDMLQEMRRVVGAHRMPGMAQVLRMAIVGDARTTGFGDGLGMIAVGRPADLVLIDRNQISYLYLGAEKPLPDALIQRAKTGGVRTVVCDGEVLYADGRFTRIDRDAALKALHDDLSRAHADDGVERRQLFAALLLHVRRFYVERIDPSRHEPFYQPSSRV